MFKYAFYSKGPFFKQDDVNNFPYSTLVILNISTINRRKLKSISPIESFWFDNFKTSTARSETTSVSHLCSLAVTQIWRICILIGCHSTSWRWRWSRPRGSHFLLLFRSMEKESYLVAQCTHLVAVRLSIRVCCYHQSVPGGEVLLLDFRSNGI